VVHARFHRKENEMAAEDSTTDLDLDVEDYEEYGTFGEVPMCGVTQSSNVQCNYPMCA
jgi:hypothetical protein